MLGAPDWCTFGHTKDDLRDDLILHQGDEHHPGERFAETGDRLSIRVSRTDCPSEGRIGTPVLAVSGELYLETWKQAAELAWQDAQRQDAAQHDAAIRRILEQARTI